MAPHYAPPLSHAETCPVPCCASPDDPAVTGVPVPPEPYTEAEFDALLHVVWNISDDDPYRFSDLLADALAYLAAVAIRPDTNGREADRAAGMLRRVEQRALWGPQ